MSTKTIVLLAIAAVIALFGCTYCGTALSYRSSCVRAEAGIKAQHEQNKNSYDSMWKKFREMAQVPDMYADALKKLYDSTMEKRYGADGSKAIFQFIQEHNPNLDASVYTKLQAAIEAGRNGFAADQQQLIAKKQAYEVILNGNTAVFVGFWFDFPRIDLDKFNIVTSDQTQDAFRSGKADEVKLH